jgi:hypothetical protein
VAGQGGRRRNGSRRERLLNLGFALPATRHFCPRDPAISQQRAATSGAITAAALALAILSRRKREIKVPRAEALSCDFLLRAIVRRTLLRASVISVYLSDVYPSFIRRLPVVYPSFIRLFARLTRSLLFPLYVSLLLYPYLILTLSFRRRAI